MSFAKYLKIFIFFISGLIIISDISIAQQKGICGTMYLDSLRRINNHELETPRDFELWLHSKLALKDNERINEIVYTIPVVVHVIHNGAAFGTGSNISDAQVLSQIRILNEDFRRKNPDTINTPNDFLYVAADCRIEFALANTDPWGNATNGIVRVRGSFPYYDILNYPSEDKILKSESYWPSDDYLNIWVANLGEAPYYKLLGYAQFPQSNLAGLGIQLQDALTDGVVIDYRVFGDVGSLIPPYDLGRTTTHEVGHYLGLRHTWGDGDCFDDDYCKDTPDCDGPYFSVKPLCYAWYECSGKRRMIENYMDYSDDACMNLFTFDQKMRMKTVLENSPRRPHTPETENYTLENLIYIYPNPVNEFLIIDVMLKNYEDVILSLFDQLGKSVYNNHYTDVFNIKNIELDLGTYNNGIYFLKINSSSFNEVKKIVIIH